jgi:hypothetical protein
MDFSRFSEEKPAKHSDSVDELGLMQEREPSLCDQRGDNPLRFECDTL